MYFLHFIYVLHRNQNDSHEHETHLILARIPLQRHLHGNAGGLDGHLHGLWLVGKEFAAEPVGGFGGEHTDGGTGTDVVPVVAVAAHTVDGGEGGHAISGHGNPG